MRDALLVVAGFAAAEALRLIRELALERGREGKVLEAEARQDAREDAFYRRETRAARRLIADELDTVANHLAMMLRKNVWPESAFLGKAYFLPTNSWEQHRVALAQAMDVD